MLKPKIIIKYYQNYQYELLFLIDAQRSEVSGYFLVNIYAATVTIADIVQFPSAFIQQIVSVIFGKLEIMLIIDSVQLEIIMYE